MASFLVWTCQKKRCEQSHPHSDAPDSTGYQKTRATQEEMTLTGKGSHDGRGCYPQCNPEPKRVDIRRTMPNPTR